MKTHAGSDFMVVFNAWYYSFSPSVADYLTTHQAERTIMKGLLYPLLAILFLSSQVFSATDFNPELASVLAGLVASSLIGAFYIALPITLLRTKMHRLRGPRLQRLLENSLEVAILGEFIVFILGETFTSTILLMMSSAAIVLSTLSLSAAFISARIAEKLQSN
jgi:protein-S-isoprenylcysteine O-methyltransferase Ste14